MGPNTRARVSNNALFLTDTFAEKIKDTLDPIQKTFETLPEYLPFWRFALYQRYAGDFKPKGIVSKWTDRGCLHAPLPTTPVLTCTSVPAELDQSTVEIRHTLSDDDESSKLLVIHIYFTTALVLIQGKACRAWVEAEFNTLVGLVHTLACLPTGSDYLAISEISKPDKDTSRAILLERPSRVSDDLALLEKSPSSPQNHRGLSATSRALLPLDYTLRGLDTSLTLNKSMVPTELFPPLQSPQPPIESPQPPPPQLHSPPEPCSFEPDGSSKMADSTVPSSNTQSDHLETCHADCVPRSIFEQVVANLRDEIAALRASLKQHAQQTGNDITALETLVQHFGKPTASPKTTAFAKATSASKTNAASLSSQSPTPRLPSPSYSSTPIRSSTLTKENVNATSTTPSPALPASEPTPLHSPPQDDMVEAVKVKEKGCKPAEVDDWPFFDIHPTTTTVILGDSVVKGLHETKMAVAHEDCQVVAVPGLDKAKLLETLGGTAPLPLVTTVVVHIGVNDCMRGRVLGNQAWRSITTALRRCFPRARVMISSILPHKTQHAHYTSCIVDSNMNLGHVCRQLGYTFIDNDAMFYTADGQLKTRWMKDHIHPNNRGCSALAVNIKRHYSLDPNTPPVPREQLSHRVHGHPRHTQQQHYYVTSRQPSQQAVRQPLMQAPSSFPARVTPPPTLIGGNRPLYSTVAKNGLQSTAPPPPPAASIHVENRQLHDNKRSDIDKKIILELLTRLICS